ncbi:potassium channel family protein [Cloacibacillus porcorum]|uniref:potassium channel family protein n=1 Tax=Cloacibacillus porcorum TaxID=1197717 RepID=UPI0026723F72|nr:potassium channel family protein [Cloacibacillus porcorum]
MQPRDQIFQRYDIFLIILALVSVSIVITEGRVALSAEHMRIMAFADNVIWLIFVVDYFSRLLLAKDKKVYIKSHIIELVAILPFNALFKGLRAIRIVRVFRATKVLRILRLTRVVAYFGRAISYTNHFMTRHNFRYVLIITASIVLMGSALIVNFEKMNFADALWWSFVTATTVGYGDLSPTTTGGRVVASFLMLAGIGFISILTGTIASFFMAEEKRKTAKEEIVNVAIRKLEDFDNLSIEELDDLFRGLRALKTKYEIEQVDSN